MNSAAEPKWIVEMLNRLDNMDIKEDSEVDTHLFLACFEDHLSGVYHIFFGGEGVLSRQLSSDLDGNLKKIRRHFEANKEDYATLEKLVITEVALKGKDNLYKEKDVAVKGLLWLNRTLNFICTMIEKLYTEASKNPSLCAKESYSETLEQFHGFIGRTTFTTAVGYCAAERSTLVTLFGFDDDESFIASAKLFVNKVKPMIKYNFALLDKYDVHFKYKVM